MVAHTCIPSYGKLRQENQVQDQSGQFSKTPSQNENQKGLEM